MNREEYKNINASLSPLFFFRVFIHEIDVGSIVATPVIALFFFSPLPALADVSLRLIFLLRTPRCPSQTVITSHLPLCQSRLLLISAFSQSKSIASFFSPTLLFLVLLYFHILFLILRFLRVSSPSLPCADNPALRLHNLLYITLSSLTFTSFCTLLSS